MRSIVDLSSILAALHDLKTLHRVSAWSVLPERYGRLRSSLVALRASRPQLDENQKTVLQSAIQHLADLEVNVDRLLLTSKTPTNVHRINAVISGEIDALTELLTKLQREEISHG
jgi:hypothetical protein